MRRGRRRRRAENARRRQSALSSLPPRRRTGAACCRRDDWALRRPSLRTVSWRSFEFRSLFDPVGALRVDHGDEADNAAVAAVPVPREEREGAAPPGHLVELAADVLDAEDAILEQNAMHRLPLREVLLPVAAAR